MDAGMLCVQMGSKSVMKSWKLGHVIKFSLVKHEINLLANFTCQNYKEEEIIY